MEKQLLLYWDCCLFVPLGEVEEEPVGLISLTSKTGSQPPSVRESSWEEESSMLKQKATEIVKT